MGVTRSRDRMFGSAGVQPWLQMTGATFGSANFQHSEVGSLTQYYDTTAMVNADVAQYSRRQFGRCWALQGAEQLLGAITGSVKSLSTKLTALNYTPVTFARAWRRGGTVTFTLPKYGTYTLVAVLGAQSHQEVAFYALTGDWFHARPVIEATLESVLARLAPGSATSAA